MRVVEQADVDVGVRSQVPSGADLASSQSVSSCKQHLFMFVSVSWWRCKTMSTYLPHNIQ